MCQTCGCSTESGARITDLGGGADHAHRQAHEHGDHHHHHGEAHLHDHHHHDGDDHHQGGDEHDHHATSAGPETRRAGDGPPYIASNGDARPRTIRLEEDLLAKNDRLAERNRGRLEAKHIVAWNLMSSPGAGKTTLLERTIGDLGGEFPISVIEGDQETARDAERIRATGCRVVQINTGSGCHLDADMIAAALRQVDPPDRSLLLIENVGNLVCPALFDLGERGKVVIMSVTEGEDKPLKYPHMFRAAEVLILNKIDLLPHVRFDVGACLGYARRVNPALRVFEVSATRGDGLDPWYDWLRAQMSGGEAAAAGTESWQPS